MQLVKAWLLVGAALLVGTCHAQNNDTCDYSAIGITPFPLDLNLIVGKEWYVQEIFARNPADAVDPDFECFMHYLQVYLGTDITALVEQYTDISTGVSTHNATTASKMEPGVFYVSLDDLRQQYTAVWTHTDYENYGVMHWCPYSDNVEGARHNYERVLTFTGTPNPDQALLSQLRGMVSSLGFPTEFGVTINQHDGCDYNVCEAANESCCDPKVVNVPPMEDIDNSRFDGQRWYVQEMFYAQEGFPEPPSCYAQSIGPYAFDIMYLQDVYTVANSTSNEETVYLVIPEVWGGNKAVWEVTSQFGHDKYTTVFTNTDYENYGVMHYCPNVENAKVKLEHVFTFTSTPNPDQSLLQVLRAMVTSFGFPTEHAVRIQHPEDCDYQSN